MILILGERRAHVRGQNQHQKSMRTNQTPTEGTSSAKPLDESALHGAACSVLDVDFPMEIRRAANNILAFLKLGMEHPIGKSSLEFVIYNIHTLTFLDSTCSPERDRLEEWLRSHDLKWFHRASSTETPNNPPSTQPIPESASDRSGDNLPEQ
jgi:hypothetical protein